MEVEARDVEGPVAVVAVRGLEVGGAVEVGGVGIPQAAAEIGEQGQAGPQVRDLRDEQGVVVDGAQGVVQRVFCLLYLPRHFVNIIAPTAVHSSLLPFRLRASAPPPALT